MPETTEYFRYLHPHLTVLVTCGKGDERNIITVAWHMPISVDPPLLGISVAHRRHSHGLIRRYREFVVNVPALDIISKVHRCGSVSGRDVDKFSDTGLTPAESSAVSVPSIMECPVSMECRLEAEHDLGDHTLFVGRVVHIRKNDEMYDGTLLKEEHSWIGHLGRNVYIDRWGRIHRE